MKVKLQPNISSYNSHEYFRRGRTRLLRWVSYTLLCHPCGRNFHKSVPFIRAFFDLGDHNTALYGVSRLRFEFRWNKDSYNCLRCTYFCICVWFFFDSGFEFTQPQHKTVFTEAVDSTHISRFKCTCWVSGLITLSCDLHYRKRLKWNFGLMDAE
jgi:hypothetical protein